MAGGHLALPLINADRCTGCGWCVGVCAPHVLSLQTNAHQKKSTLDDPEHCTGCALCALRCPFDAIQMVRKTARARTLISRDDASR